MLSTPSTLARYILFGLSIMLALASCASEVTLGDAEADVDATPMAGADGAFSTSPLVGSWSDEARYGADLNVYTFAADGTYTVTLTDTGTGCGAAAGSLLYGGSWSATATVLTLHFQACSGQIVCSFGVRQYCPPTSHGGAVVPYSVSPDGHTLTLTPPPSDAGTGVEALTRVR